MGLFDFIVFLIQFWIFILTQRENYYKFVKLSLNLRAFLFVLLNVAYTVECGEVSQAHVWNVICDLTWNGLKVRLSQGLEQKHSQKGWTLNQWWSIIRRWKAGPSGGGCMEEETGCTALRKGRAAWDYRSWDMDRTSLWAFEGTCSASTTLADVGLQSCEEICFSCLSLTYKVPGN